MSQFWGFTLQKNEQRQIHRKLSPTRASNKSKIFINWQMEILSLQPLTHFFFQLALAIN